MKSTPYRIEFTPEAGEHVKDLSARERATLLDGVERQLLHEPTRETRNRKPLRPNPVAQYRLRLGSLRVYYDVDGGPPAVVLVRAVGVKVRQRVLIGGKEVML